MTWTNIAQTSSSFKHPSVETVVVDVPQVPAMRWPFRVMAGMIAALVLFGLTIPALSVFMKELMPAAGLTLFTFQFLLLALTGQVFPQGWRR